MLRRNRKRSRIIHFERLEQRLAPAASIFVVNRLNDFVGPSASMGPDGNTDIHFELRGLAAVAISAVQVTAYYTDASSPQNWLYGSVPTPLPIINNPTALPSAILNRFSSSLPQDPNYPKSLSDTNTTADLYINPIVANKQISYFQVKITYATNPLTTETINSGSQTSLSTTNITASHSDGTTLTTTAGGSATFQSQYAADVAPGTSGWVNGTPKQGDIRITLDTLPSGVTFANIVGLSLSDGVGGHFGSGDVNTPNQGSAIWSSTSGTGLRLSYKQAAGGSGYIADIAVPPIRNEDGASMTLRIDTSSQTYYDSQFTGKSVNLIKAVA
jgi:hypothetical protein